MDFNRYIEDNKTKMIEDLQAWIRVKSVMGEAAPGCPFGEGPKNALLQALKSGKELGFRTKNVDNYAGYIEFGEGEEEIGILAHVDVVPEGEDWTHGPYDGEIIDGIMFGRGTLDDKGPAVAALYAMKAIKDSGVSLSKRVRLILGTNEENGSEGIAYYLTKEKMPTMGFTPDADFPVIYGEKGIGIFELSFDLDAEDQSSVLSFSGGSAANMVPDSCKLVIKNDGRLLNDHDKVKREHVTVLEKDGVLELTAKGKAAHGSTPWKGNNAVSNLVDALKPAVNPNTSFGKFIELYDAHIGFDFHGERIGCHLSDEESGELSLNLGVLTLKEGTVVMTINVRYPIHCTGTEVEKGIEEVLRGKSLKFSGLKEDVPPLHVPKDHPLVETLMRVYREETGDLESEPITIGGGTYARECKNMVAFGALFPGDEDTMHQRNESIPIERLMRITKIYAKAIYELAK